MLTDTLCWTCAKACGGYDCPWVAKFKPVDGWTAEKTLRSYANGEKVESFRVIACPLYEKWDREALHKQEEGEN